MKIVINSDYGGFGLSREAIDRYCAEKGIYPGKWNDTYSYYPEFSENDIPRDDEVLVKIVEELSANVNGIGGKADGRFSELKIVEVPAKQVRIDTIALFGKDYYVDVTTPPARFVL